MEYKKEEEDYQNTQSIKKDEKEVDLEKILNKIDIEEEKNKPIIINNQKSEIVSKKAP